MGTLSTLSTLTRLPFAFQLFPFFCFSAPLLLLLCWLLRHLPTLIPLTPLILRLRLVDSGSSLGQISSRSLLGNSVSSILVTCCLFCQSHLAVLSFRFDLDLNRSFNLSLSSSVPCRRIYHRHELFERHLTRSPLRTAHRWRNYSSVALLGCTVEYQPEGFTSSSSLAIIRCYLLHHQYEPPKYHTMGARYRQ